MYFFLIMVDSEHLVNNFVKTSENVAEFATFSLQDGTLTGKWSRKLIPPNGRIYYKGRLEFSGSSW